MTVFTDNSILRARQQEHQKLPKILAYGIGGSLAFHGIAAVALNYLPQPIPAPVEVTLIDPSELPPELKPSPQPPKIKPTPKPKTIVKITPTPTPSVKITPIPTPRPSVKTKPDLTPQVIKIVTRPVVPFIPAQKVTKTAVINDFEKEQNQVRNLLPKNPSQQSQSVTKPSKKQVRSNPDQIPEAFSSSGVNSSPLNNTQLAFKDPAQSTKASNFSGTEPNSSAGASQSDDHFNNGSPGNGNSSQAATPGNLAARNIDKTAGSNGQPLTAGRTGTGKFGSSSNSSSEGTGGDSTDGFNVELIPGSGGGSRSVPQTGAGSGNNGQLAYDQTGNTGRGLGNSDKSGSADGFDHGDGSFGGSNPGGFSRLRSSGIIHSGGKGFGSGLECVTNCDQKHSEILDHDLTINAKITLDNSGKVADVKLPSPSENTALNDFTKDAFGKMQFKLPASVTKRIFSVYFRFKATPNAG
jgi:hypothetical protein